MAIGTPVQLGATTAASGGSTLVLTTSGDAPAGGLVVVAVGRSTTGALTSVTDSGGNTYVAGPSYSDATSRVAWFWSFNAVHLPSGGTITVTYVSTGGVKLMAAASVSGCAAADLQGSGATAVSTTPSLATGTLGWPGEIVFGQIEISAGAADAYTEAAGFTANTAALSTDALRWAYQIVGSTAPVTYAPTLGTSRAWGANTVTFSGALASPYNRASRLTYLEM